MYVLNTTQNCCTQRYKKLVHVSQTNLFRNRMLCNVTNDVTVRKHCVNCCLLSLLFVKLMLNRHEFKLRYQFILLISLSQSIEPVGE